MNQREWAVIHNYRVVEHKKETQCSICKEWTECLKVHRCKSRTGDEGPNY